MITGLHHVQIACPAGSEDVLREFYGALLGLPEIPKPPELARRGGVWFRVGEQELHCGVEEDFRPARKAHPAFLVEDVNAMADRLEVQGFSLTWQDNVPGVRRFHLADPLGNRVELQQR